MMSATMDSVFCVMTRHVVRSVSSYSSEGVKLVVVGVVLMECQSRVSIKTISLCRFTSTVTLLHLVIVDK